MRSKKPVAWCARQEEGPGTMAFLAPIYCEDQGDLVEGDAIYEQDMTPDQRALFRILVTAMAAMGRMVTEG